MLDPMLIGLLSFLATLFVIIGLSQRSREYVRRSALQERLQAFQQQSALSDELMGVTTQTEERKLGALESFVRGFGRQLAETTMAGSGGQGLIEFVDHQLTKAGNPHDLRGTDFIGWCVVGFGVTGLLGFLGVSVGLPGWMFLALLALTAMYPYVTLKSWIRQRQEQAFAEFPYFLDEIIQILSSQSATLDQAIREVVLRKDDGLGLADSQRVLVREFRRAYLEVANQSRPADAAYRAAADRLELQEVSDFVEVLVESYHSGAPVLSILKNMSQHVFTLFEQRMYTLIKQKDSAFTVATVVIMLGVAIIILEPIALTVIQALSGGGIS